MRSKTAVACVIAIALGLAPAFASAAVVSGIQPALEGMPWIGTPGSASRSISSFSTSYDNAAGTWTTSVAFYGPESAATAATLYVGLGTRRAGAGSALIRASTDPATPNASYALTGGASSTSMVSPAPVTTFSADRRTVTITVSDPALVGRFFDTATVRLSKSNTKYDILPAMTLTPNGVLGPDPRISLPFSDRMLRLRGGRVTLRIGVVTVPSSVAAFLEINGKQVAILNGLGLAHNPHTLRLYEVPAGHRLVRQGRPQNAKVVVLIYSTTGRLTSIVQHVALSS